MSSASARYIEAQERGASGPELDALLFEVGVERGLIGPDAGRSEPKKEKRTPKYLNWSGLSQLEPPPRRWIIAEWLGTGSTLCAGRGGAGKSTLAQTMASALATQSQFIGVPERPIVSLMWACEDDHDELWRRQVHICAALGIEMRSLEDIYYCESRLGEENTLYAPAFGTMQWTSVLDQLREQVNDVAADVLWLDNIGHTFGGNESDRHQVTSFINGILGIRKEMTVVLLGHPARAKGSEFAGSAAWENAVRSRWYFGDTLPDKEKDGDDEAKPEDDIRYLCRRKANYTFRDYMRFRFRDGVFLPDEPERTTFADRFGADSQQESMELILVDGFDKCLAAGITPTDGHTSPDYLPRRLVDMGLNGGFGKKELGRAMNRLLAAGRFKRTQVGTYANRNPKFGLIKP